MADQDDNQQHTVFHDLGQHLANAYQQFLDAKKSYGESNPAQAPESIQAGQQPAPANAQPSPVSVQSDNPLQNVSQIPPQQANMMQQPAQIPQMQQPQPLTPTDDAGAGSNGLPGPLQAETNLAKAQQDEAKNVSKTYDEGLAKQQELVKQTYSNFQNNQAQDQQLMNAYMNKTIDPNRVISNMTTGNKIMTSLGLLFSGIGSGITGQKNLALEMINNNISRDLEAQKSAQGQAYNAYQMHREGTKDEFTADLQHQKDNMLAIDAAIEQQKAKLMGPQAIAAATQTQLALRGQILDLNQKSAMWNATKQALAGASQSGDPASKIRAMQLTGQIQPAQAEAAYKELDRTQNFSTQQQNILDSFDKANQENTIAGRAAHLGSQPASVAALQNQIMPYLKDAEGRINETEIKRVDSLIPSPGDGAHKIAEKRQALKDFMNEKSSSSMLKGLGINVPSQSSTKQAQYEEGTTATNSKGMKIVFKGGKWNPM